MRAKLIRAPPGFSRASVTVVTSSGATLAYDGSPETGRFGAPGAAGLSDFSLTRDPPSPFPWGIGLGSPPFPRLWRMVTGAIFMVGPSSLFTRGGK